MLVEQKFREPKEWKQRFENYRHAMLYTIRTGKVGIRKHYCGWKTFVHLSSNNIRYLLELVHQTLIRHRESNKSLSDPVGFDVQTLTAQAVGMKNVAELEGLSAQGANLTKLVLGLGRIFQVLAYNPKGRAPEQNQFRLSEKGLPPNELKTVLDAAIMHLALVRTSGTKLAGEGDVREYDYSLHPIFAPFFVYSYRKKRKISLSSRQLSGLIHDSRVTIREILGEEHEPSDAPLPEQLRLFEGYYGHVA